MEENRVKCPVIEQKTLRIRKIFNRTAVAGQRSGRFVPLLHHIGFGDVTLFDI